MEVQQDSVPLMDELFTVHTNCKDARTKVITIELFMPHKLRIDEPYGSQLAFSNFGYLNEKISVGGFLLLNCLSC